MAGLSTASTAHLQRIQGPAESAPLALEANSAPAPRQGLHNAPHTVHAQQATTVATAEQCQSSVQAGGSHSARPSAAARQHEQAGRREHEAQLLPPTPGPAGNYCLQLPVGGPHVRSVFMQPGPSRTAPAAASAAASTHAIAPAGCAHCGPGQGQTAVPSHQLRQHGMSAHAAAPPQSLLRPYGGQTAQQPSAEVPQRIYLPPARRQIGKQPLRSLRLAQQPCRTDDREADRSEAGPLSAGGSPSAAAASAHGGHARGPSQFEHSSTCTASGPFSACGGIAAAICRPATPAATAEAAATAAAGAAAGWQWFRVPRFRAQGALEQVCSRVRPSCSCNCSGRGPCCCRRQGRHEAAEHRGVHGTRRRRAGAAGIAAGAARQRVLLGGDPARRRNGHIGGAREGPLLQRCGTGRDAQVTNGLSVSAQGHVRFGGGMLVVNANALRG